MKSNKFILFMRGLVGLHNVVDGSTCEFSKTFWDIHDYKLTKGGNGHAWHFYAYRCPYCGKNFRI